MYKQIAIVVVCLAFAVAANEEPWAAPKDVRTVQAQASPASLASPAYQYYQYAPAASQYSQPAPQMQPKKAHEMMKLPFLMDLALNPSEVALGVVGIVGAVTILLALLGLVSKMVLGVPLLGIASLFSKADNVLPKPSDIINTLAGKPGVVIPGVEGEKEVDLGVSVGRSSEFLVPLASKVLESIEKFSKKQE